MKILGHSNVNLPLQAVYKHKLCKGFTEIIPLFVEENTSTDGGFYNLTLILRWLYTMKWSFRKAEGTGVNIAMNKSLKK